MDKRVEAAAKALARRHADECGVNFDDLWKLEGEWFLADALSAVTAADAAAPQAVQAVGAVPASRINITLRQAKRLLAFFGDNDALMTVESQGNGLVVYCTEYPEEGGDNLGPTEVDDALATNPAQRAPADDRSLFEQWVRDTAKVPQDWLHKFFLRRDDGGYSDRGMDWQWRAFQAGRSAGAVPADCVVPPAGWKCTRVAGHEGPCAAIPTPPEVGIGQQEMISHATWVASLPLTERPTTLLEKLASLKAWNAAKSATPPAQAQPASFEREFTDDSATAQAQQAPTDERAAFEAWARDQWGDKSWPDNAWLGWQARASFGGGGGV